jgi:CheY-like chemotaxis protein
MSGVRRILVIDDEPALGHLLENLMSDIVVACESSASGALARIRRGEAFDRILCDVMMPEVSGMEFYEQLDERLRPSIVFVTGGSFTERARRFLERVPNRTIFKPFDMAELERALVG